jgi:hypothetical protein
MKDKYNIISIDDAIGCVKQIIKKDKTYNTTFIKLLLHKLEDMMIEASANYIIENSKMHPDVKDLVNVVSLKKTKKKKPVSLEQRKEKFVSNCRYISWEIENISYNQVTNFIDYWTEKNISGRLMKFEMQKTFEIKRRLVKWRDNNKEWSVDKKKKYIPIESRFTKVKSQLYYKAWCSKCGKVEMPSNKWELQKGSTCCAVEYSPTKIK